MRQFFLIALLFISSIPAPVMANDHFLQIDGITFTGGLWGDSTNRRGWRIAPRWDWNVNWLENFPITVTGYWEAGVGNWSAFHHHDGGNDNLWIISASEVFQFWVGPTDKTRNALFFEFGIGPAYLSETELGKRDFGNHWAFEDKFGAGVNFGTERPVQLIYRYYHYSNAGFSMPNNGLDIHSLAFVLFF